MDGGLGAVVLHGDLIQHRGVGPAGPDAGEVADDHVDGLLHFAVVGLDHLVHVLSSSTMVPILSPITARRMFS